MSTMPNLPILFWTWSIHMGHSGHGAANHTLYISITGLQFQSKLQINSYHLSLSVCHFYSSISVATLSIIGGCEVVCKPSSFLRLGGGVSTTFTISSVLTKLCMSLLLSAVSQVSFSKKTLAVEINNINICCRYVSIYIVYKFTILSGLAYFYFYCHRPLCPF